jgi:N-acetylneuraminic acid mutarotase
MPLLRGAGIAVTLDDRIYVLGGVGPEPEVALEYDPAADTWSRRAAMPAPREHLAAAAFDGRIYVVGGRWTEGNTDRLEVYDPAADAWRALPSMPTPRGGLAAAALDERIHVVGGEELGSGGSTFEEHEVYEPATDTWASASTPPSARHGLAAQAVEGRLYVIGGGETPGLSTDDAVEVFEPG